VGVFGGGGEKSQRVQLIVDFCAHGGAELEKVKAQKSASAIRIKKVPELGESVSAVRFEAKRARNSDKGVIPLSAKDEKVFSWMCLPGRPGIFFSQESGGTKNRQKERAATHLRCAGGSSIRWNSQRLTR